jgi:outer membrane lipoprotein-sorting protein
MGKLILGVTGDIAWQQSPFEGNFVLQGDAAALMRDDASPNPLLNWQETYETAEVSGEENGTTVVVFTTRGGTATTRYFDNTSGLLTKQVQPDPSGSSLTNTFTDYKKVGEVMQAHKIGVDTVEVQLELTFTSMELNTQIDDSTFDIPDVIKALLPD